MPRMPKWLANTTEKLFSKYIHPVTILDITDLDNQLRKVRFKGSFEDVKYQPGNVIEFRINETDFRHYTLSFFDAQEGICEVIFYLHNFGPGSHWVKDLQVGDRLNIMGPGGKISFQEQASRQVLIGDETSLGFCQAMTRAGAELGARCLCLLELDEEHFYWPEHIGLNARTFLADHENPAANLILCEELAEPDVGSTFYLTGRAKSIQTLRKYLKEKGVPVRQILAEPYWADGKVGL